MRLVALLTVLLAASPAFAAKGKTAKAAPAAAPKAPPKPSFEIVPQSGHAGVITTLSTTKDGAYAVTAGSDGTARLWELSTGREIRSYGVQERSADSCGAVLSANGKLVYFSRDSNFTFSFDLATGEQVGQFEHAGTLLARSADGRFFVNTLTPSLVLFETGPGQRGFTGERPNPYNATPVGKVYAHLNLPDLGLTEYRDVRQLEFSADGEQLAVCGSKRVAIVSTKEKKLIRGIDGLQELRSCTFSPDGKQLAVAQKSGVRLFNAIGTQQAELAVSESAGIAYSPDGQRLAVTNGKELLVYQAPFTAAPKRVAIANHEPALVTFVEGGRTLLTAGGRTLVLTDLDTLREIRRMSPNVAATLGLEFSPKGRRLLAQVQSGSELRLDVWNLDEARLELSLPVSNSQRAWFGPDGSSLLFQTNTGVFSLAFDGRKRRQLTMRFTRVTDYADGRLLTCDDKQCEIRDVTTTAVTATFPRPTTTDRELMLLPDGQVGRVVAVDYSTHDVTIWKPTMQGLGSPVAEQKGLKGDRFNHEGARFAAHSYMKGTLCPSTGTCTELKKPAVSGEPDAMSQAITFALSGPMAAGACDITGTVYLWNHETGEAHRLLGHRKPGAKVSFSSDGALLASGGYDGGIRLWNAKTGEPLAQLLSSGSKWLITTPDGYFDASNDGGELVSVVKDNHAFGVDQFALRNNRPDLIMERLGSTRVDIRDHYRSRYLRRLARAGVKEQDLAAEPRVPEAKIVRVDRDGDAASIDVEFADAHAPLLSYNVFVNDVPLFGGRGKPLSGAKAKITERIPLTPGLNKIEASATNAQGAESFRALVSLTSTDSKKGDLYFVGFGVSKYARPELALGFAHKDAQDLSATFGHLKSQFADIHARVLVDEAVTPDAIRASKEFLSASKPEDTVVLFIAGHGMHDDSPTATYYFLTHDADPAHLQQTSADFELVEDLLQGIGARRKLFLMDTCESGEAEPGSAAPALALAEKKATARAVRGLKRVEHKTVATPTPSPRGYLLQTDRFIYNDLVRRSGAIVFSSSRGGEFSYESEKIGNGYFTQAVKQAIGEGKADGNADHVVTIDELRGFVAKSVADATNDAQHPTIDRDNLSNRFGFEVSP